MKSIIFAVVLASIGGCAATSQTSSMPPLTEIDIILSDPRQYHGKFVRVRGAAMARFEAYFICPAPEVMENWGGSKKCLALVTGEGGDSSFRVEQIDGKTVEIVGRFNAERFGHMGAYGGMISAVSAKVLGSHNMREAPPPPPVPPRPAASSPNNAFKPTPLRSAKHMAGTACHVLGSTTRRGLT